MKRLSSRYLFIVILCCCSVIGLAQTTDHHHQKASLVSDQKFLGLGDGITTCAVTGETLENTNISGDFFGRQVYFCCPGCLAKAQMHPDLYVRRTVATRQSGTEIEAESNGERPQSERTFKGKGDGVMTCPVTGEPVNKETKVEVNGRTFYVCCAGCIDLIQKAPDLYLKPEKADAGRDPKFLGKGDGAATCPVTGEPINKDVRAEIDGRIVYACCPGCLDQIKKNPALYLRKN